MLPKWRKLELGKHLLNLHSVVIKFALLFTVALKY